MITVTGKKGGTVYGIVQVPVIGRRRKIVYL